MLRFVDSFDHLATADITTKWTALGNSPTITANGRRSTSALTCATSSDRVSKTLDAQATWIVGVAVKFTGAIASAGYLIYLGDAGANQCGVFMNTDGTLSFRRGTTNVATSATALSADTFYFVEFKVTINNSGSYEIRVNGANVLSGSGVDTQQTANATANQVLLNGLATGGSNGFDATAVYFDDLYICDSSGSTNNDFLGDIRVDAYLPNGNGNSSQMVGSDSNSTDNYLLVDDATQDGDSTYVQSSTAGEKDTYAFANMSHTPSSIYGVQVNMIAKKDDAGARSIASVVRSDGADTDGTTQALSTSYADYMQIVEQDPDTSAAWTKTGFNAAEFGHKVAA